MKLRSRASIAALGAAAWLLVLGFVLFAASVMRDTPDQGARADGIVVLTGTEARIVEGARLMREGRGQRLLISGVNRRTRPEEVLKLAGLDEPRFTCCVDLGYDARDTIGNAGETREWVETHRFQSLIVVTSRYHMPRSLTELRMAMPNVTLIPQPVAPRAPRNSAWWLQAQTTRVLISEYLKFLPAAARLAIARAFRPAPPATAEISHDTASDSTKPTAHR